ncbi:hypothetical protein GWN26_03075 [Candidatus Saccharibacteria bacterium]|nr:hypothetical protein [Candidatus Saccharibacteria bacterium]NIV03362.1 hypothetical protein [Calditrichia bacterium]NIS37908.1 hypothetical protein [Candidatus Saccharibacteria bacterium]NIV71571.1 hypothetical protein [Calditrichia bacterium]NIV98173.1 hypothetical protein [Candidatus Saccharibacteria bacterium]
MGAPDDDTDVGSEKETMEEYNNRMSQALRKSVPKGNGKAVLGKVYYLGLERTPNGGIRIVWKERKLGAL